jgi:F420-0:gamma-glutamyl ligase
MIAIPLKTEAVVPGGKSLLELLDKYLDEVPESSVLAITSKVVSICEGRTVPIDGLDEMDLIKQESQLFIDPKNTSYGSHPTITRNTLASSAGIDKSNGGGHYILWPADPQTTANEVRAYLKKRFGLERVGVVITDSTSIPFRLGTTGIVLAFSGFEAINNYIGSPDIFGRPFEVSRANAANGLAGIAVTVMGEGAEQTPLVLMQDLPFVSFTDRDPTQDELDNLKLKIESDLYSVFWKNAPWQKGDQFNSY